MVFQKPNPFPKSIYDNVAFGPRINGGASGLDEIVEQALTNGRAVGRGEGQAQEDARSRSRAASSSACASRAALAVEPDVILMDEPCSALDPIATARIEDLMAELKRDYTIVIVTHNMQQAARVSDRTAFLTAEVDDDGHRRRALVEYDAHREDLHQPVRPAHRGLHHRSVRMSDRLARCDGAARRRRSGRVACCRRRRELVAARRSSQRVARSRRRRRSSLADAIADERSRGRRPGRAVGGVAALAARRARRVDATRSSSSTASAARSCATRPRAASTARGTARCSPRTRSTSCCTQALRGHSSRARAAALRAAAARSCSCARSRCRRDGEIVGAVAFIRDISEARRVESVRRDFVANVSHELKTPIGALGLLAETMAATDDVRGRAAARRAGGARSRPAGAHRRRPARPQHRSRRRSRRAREPLPVRLLIVARRSTWCRPRPTRPGSRCASRPSRPTSRSSATAARCAARSSTCSTTRSSTRSPGQPVEVGAERRRRPRRDRRCATTASASRRATSSASSSASTGSTGPGAATPAAPASGSRSCATSRRRTAARSRSSRAKARAPRSRSHLAGRATAARDLSEAS